MSKYIKIKEIIFYSIFFLILYFVLRDLKELVEFYQFDTNALDLTADGVALRNRFFSSSYDPAVMYRAIIDYTILLLPLMIVVALYKYNKIKNKSFKYLIGKSKSINKYLLTLKIRVSLLPVVFFYIVLLIYTVVSYILTGFKVRKGANFDDFVPENNIFSFVNGSFFGYIVLLVVFTGMYIFFTTMLLITLIDYGYNYIYLTNCK
ncbi:hypothetical protein HMPREF1983_00341 [Gemella bergeri ATCC 700627]|uniref:Uncharacterized protein n=1 Tax=Gemella bergeri ATCC 700627 TaxID=1321820 RepID=U2SB69_9BACL|nr:hypothetical protein [Gemella bergeri]ERK59987.1 hypothetical protein HMPREF1983_00341 [Gemella bergeri ATCC 700627]